MKALHPNDRLSPSYLTTAAVPRERAGSSDARPARLAVAMTMVALVASGAPGAQPRGESDLDAFMARVLAQRDESWKTLQQYILEERERVQILGPGRAPVYGAQREYLWFPRDGLFVRSPLRVDGVTIDEPARRRAEAEWLERQQRRERATAGGAPVPGEPPDAAEAETSADVLRQSLEPHFVSAGYFLRFRFEPGRYALVGREPLDGREVLRVEYYPARLFLQRPPRCDGSEVQAPRGRGRGRAPDSTVPNQLNRTSLITLWIVPEAHQILRYEFENVDLDFLPGRQLIRLDGIHASMHVGEPFPGVWLPRSIGMRFDLLTAAGPLLGRYEVEYYDYRLADVTTRIR